MKSNLMGLGAAAATACFTPTTIRATYPPSLFHVDCKFCYLVNYAISTVILGTKIGKLFGERFEQFYFGTTIANEIGKRINIVNWRRT
jgi:hypothetical protein